MSDPDPFAGELEHTDEFAPPGYDEHTLYDQTCPNCGEEESMIARLTNNNPYDQNYGAAHPDGDHIECTACNARFEPEYDGAPDGTPISPGGAYPATPDDVADRM